MANHVRQRFIDHYADGIHISSRRRQKAEIIGELLTRLFPQGRELELVDFGCADGAVPVEILRSPAGAMCRRITGITLLDYNDLPDKPVHAHPRFQREIADLQAPLEGLDLPWGRCDAVLATAFFHYFMQPEVPFTHACNLLKPGGYLIAGMPAPWVLRVRKHGIPGVLPRNRRILQIQSLAAWRSVAERCSLCEQSVMAVQWLGIAATRGIEAYLRRTQWLSWLGSNYLVVYRKP